MRLLLDSHALLWALHAPEKLAPAARKAIEDGGNPTFFSAASIWELSIKCSKGLLEIDDEFMEFINEAGFVELPVRAIHAWSVQSLPPVHSDPFDRILVAQAQSEQLTLVTRDQFLRQYEIPILTA
jgi:PIN domain nuclease of toxin-antitoxin system